MSTKTLFTAATAAASKVEEVYANNPMTLIGWGFEGNDAVDIQVSYDGGSNFVDCYENGLQKQLTATNNPVTVFGPGLFKLNKGITTGAVGVAKVTSP